jgi:hypothetical protein
MKDHDPLSPLLGSWKHSPSPSPDFAEGVWSRIRTAETAAPASIIRFPFAIPLPLAASVAVTLSILAGTVAALGVSRAQTTDRMAAAYVRTIDPIQMTTTGAHVHTDSSS